MDPFHKFHKMFLNLQKFRNKYKIHVESILIKIKNQYFLALYFK